MKFKTLLNEEIVNELEELGRDSIPSEEYKIRVEGVTKLMDRCIEIEKLEVERETQQDRRILEYDMESQRLKESKKDRVFKFVYGITCIGLSLGGCALGTYLTNNFEKEGSYLNKASREWHKGMFDVRRFFKD